MLLLPSRAVQSPRYRYSGWSRNRAITRFCVARSGWPTPPRLVISVLPSGRLWRGRYAGGVAVPSVWRCSALSFGWKSQPAAPVRMPPCEDAAVVIPVSAAGYGSISYRPFLRPFLRPFHQRFLRPYFPRCVLPQPRRTLQSSVEGSIAISTSSSICGSICPAGCVRMYGISIWRRGAGMWCGQRGIVTDARQGPGVRVAGRWCRGRNGP